MAKWNVQNKPGLVYLVMNKVNRKRYIGVTSRLLSQRKSLLLHAAKRGSIDLPIYQDIRAIGKENFEFSILQEYPTFAEACQGEIDYIAFYKPEYNISAGGLGRTGSKISEENRIKLHILGIQNKEKFSQYAHLGPQSQAKRVLCIDDELEYESASAAARHYGSARSAIIEMCLGTKLGKWNTVRKSVNGRKFKYLE